MDYQPEMNELNEVPAEGTLGKGMSIASMVLGIVGAFNGICCCTYVGVICGILAIVFAFVSKKQAGKFSGMAIAGLILGIVGVVGGVFSIVWGIINMEQNLAAYEDILNQFQ